MQRVMKVLLSGMAFAGILCSVVFAQELKPLKLLPPNLEGGKSLMRSLQARKSTRGFSLKELPLQVLSDLLWAANGINRPETGLRTAPSAKNMQEIDIYVALSEGLYLYDAKAAMLVPITGGDIRGLTGKQEFVKIAAVELIFVANLLKMKDLTTQQREFYAATDTGFISENVYLFCASSGLGTVVRHWIDEPALSKAMQLKSHQKIILVQTVGYPQ